LPLEDRTKDPLEWQYRSHSGFLGPGESLKGVLMQDWELVTQRLGTTHLQLAAHLRALLTLAKAEIRNEGEVVYDVSVVPSNTLVQPFGPQAIRVEKTFYLGEQYSLFFNPERADSPDNQKWDIEYCFKSARSGLSLRVGGEADRGVVTYIQHYGFYEGGGVANEYRVDPAELIALITGSVNQECIQVATTKAEQKLEKLKAEQDSEIAFEAKCRSRLEELRQGFKDGQESSCVASMEAVQEELMWITQRRDQLERTLSEETQAYKRFIDHLQSLL